MGPINDAVSRVPTPALLAMQADPPWFKVRGYAHFDSAPPKVVAVELASDPSRVARYSFWPFLGYDKVTPRRIQAMDPLGNPTGKRTLGEPKVRPITYAAHLDSHVFAKYAFDLGALLELQEYCDPALCASVLAYRRHVERRCNIHFAAEAFKEIATRRSCDAVALDIDAFFDSLSHSHLHQAWCKLLRCGDRLPADHFAVFRAVTEQRRVDRSQLRAILGRDIPRHRTPGNRRVCTPAEFRTSVREHVSAARTLGIPQGSPISAVLANLYMLAVDRQILGALAQIGASYRRYSDDILVVCAPGAARDVEDIVARTIELSGLRVKATKSLRIAFRETSGGISATSIQPHRSSDSAATALTAVPRSLSYLGFEWDGRRMVLRSQTMARFLKRLKRGVTGARLAAHKRGETRLKRAKLYRKFSFLGWDPRANPLVDTPGGRRPPRHGNFVDYSLTAASLANGPAIRRQIGKQWRRLHDEIAEAELILRRQVEEPQLARYLASKRRLRSRKTPRSKT